MGFKDVGTDVTDAELVVGTLTGSSVGAQITSSLSIEELFNFQLKPVEETKERPAEFDLTKFRQMIAVCNYELT